MCFILIITYHNADSINTVAVMKELKALISVCNIYISESGSFANVRLLESVAHYITGILKVFGVIPETTFLGFPLDKSLEMSSTTDEVYSDKFNVNPN